MPREKISLIPQAGIHNIHIAQTAQTIHLSDRFLDELHVVLHAHCADTYSKYIDGNLGAV